MNDIEDFPAKKRRRRLLGASDHVTLNVGGTRFLTTASTLTSSSSYFASLLSDNWIESNDGDEVFLDQDPDAFRTLLGYMRRGLIRVEDVDEDVLSQAEYLGLEKLLLAVKVRWYFNIGKGPVVSTEEEIAAAFDREHGGIMKAMSAGLLPLLLTQDDVNAERDLAIVDGRQTETQRGLVYFILHEGTMREGDAVKSLTLTGLVNGLFAKGYTKYEAQLETRILGGIRMTFSRRKHYVRHSHRSSGVLIPPKSDMERHRGTKQFALLALGPRAPNTDEECFAGVIIAPADMDSRTRANPYTHAVIRTQREWLELNKFVTREKWLEGLLERSIQILYNGDWRTHSASLHHTGRFYSREISFST